MRKNITWKDSALIFLLVILANLAAQMFYSFLITIIAQVTGNENLIYNTYVQLIGSLVIQVFYVTAVAVYLSLFLKNRPKLMFPIKQKVSPLSAAIAVLLPVVTIFCFLLPANWFSIFLEKINYQGSPGVELSSMGQIILGIIVIVILAPIFEEIIFRGFLLSGLKSRFSDIKAILLSGVAFALMHMNPEQTVYQFLLGATCAYVAIKSGSLILPIIIHAFSNLIALLLDLTPLGDAFYGLMNTLTGTWWLNIISTVLLFAAGVTIIYFVGKAVKKLKVYTAEPLATPAPLIGSVLDANLNVRDENYEVNLDCAPLMQKTDPYADLRYNKVGNRFFAIGLGVCAVMWFFVFISSFILTY